VAQRRVGVGIIGSIGPIGLTLNQYCPVRSPIIATG
jgi:hypothetical protein